jgi:hypothetical protein
MTEAMAELTAQLKQARADSQAAGEAVEKLRLADEVRRSRGVLGRVWAAWRGG